MKRFLFALSALHILIFFTNVNVFAELQFIANKSVQTSSISKDEIRNIFLGKTVYWNNGNPIIFVIMEGSLHKKFTRPYTRKSVSQYKNYWRKMMYTGMGTLPKKFSDEKDLMLFVSETEGAIGYISNETTPVNVKIILVK